MKLSNQNHNNALKITLWSDFFFLILIISPSAVISTKEKSPRVTLQTESNFATLLTEISPFDRNDKHVVFAAKIIYFKT
ncbi:hypothetical protein C4F50_08830 [Flavobacterium sp. KB82]|uniref:Uncharacterized protein n=1 Tax=Flavobacterium hungaricum TaxID=2082725 RepID=A0ABR9TJM1_9FLAO|nr:hypothetical protein [Flavobacterium hungaricum]